MELLLRQGPVKKRYRHSGHFKRLVEARAGFGVLSEFLILDPEIKVSFRVGGLFFDLLLAQRQIKALLRRDAFFAANFAVVMDDSRKRREAILRRDAAWVDDLVNSSVESDVG